MLQRNCTRCGGYAQNNRCNQCNQTNYQPRINPCCNVQPVQTCVNCGLTVTLNSDVEVACLCSRVTFTSTVTNNSDITARNVILTLPLDESFALLRDTVIVNGQTVAVENLDQVPLGDLEPGATATITYTVVVMESKRYVYSRAVATTCICCCFENRIVNIGSNLHLLQVCPCCSCETSSTNN